MELQVQAKWCRLAKRNHEHLIIVGFIVWIVYYMLTTVSSVQFSRSVVSDSLWHHGLQHVRPPCPSITDGDIQIHVHWVGDAIQPSHPLSSPSPPVLNLSQHHGLFKWISSSHQVAKALEFQLYISPSNEHPGLISPLRWNGWISLQSKRLSGAFSNTTVQKHQFFGTQLSV